MRRYPPHRDRKLRKARLAHERRAQLAQVLGVTVETLKGAMAMLEERQWRVRAAMVAERMRER